MRYRQIILSGILDNTQDVEKLQEALRGKDGLLLLRTEWLVRGCSCIPVGWVPALPSPWLALLAWTECLGKWHITAICRNDMIVILCLLGIWENESDDDEVLMGTAVTGPNRLFRQGGGKGLGAEPGKSLFFFFFFKQPELACRKFVPTQRD